jgi:molybdopterin synthase catalytic subunit
MRRSNPEIVIRAITRWDSTMLRSASDFGISVQNWNAAKEQAREAMIERAKVRGMIPYSELVAKIKAVKFLAHDTRLFHLLGQISVEENDSGRGMLSVVVVHKYGDMQPGPGFFVLAQHLGHDTKDLLKFWVEQLKKIHALWSIAKPENSS